MQGVHPISVIGIINVVGFAGVAVLQLILNPASLFHVPQAALPWIVAVGIAQFGIGRTSAYIGLSTIGASRVSLFMSTQAPFAAFFAIAFGGETLGPLVAVGTVAVTFGLLLASGDSLTQGWRADRRYLFGCLAGLMAGAALGVSVVLSKKAVGLYDAPLTITALGMLAAMVLVLLPWVSSPPGTPPSGRTTGSPWASCPSRG